MLTTDDQMYAMTYAAHVAAARSSADFAREHDPSGSMGGPADRAASMAHAASCLREAIDAATGARLGEHVDRARAYAVAAAAYARAAEALAASRAAGDAAASLAAAAHRLAGRGTL